MSGVEMESNIFLDYEFKKISYLEEALTHKSYANEHQASKVPDNERFEFLGDSVLGCVVTDLLMRKFTDTNEGVLSRYRSELVNERRLAEIARKVNLGERVRLGKGEMDSAGAEKDSILSSTLEAVLAAIFLDGGFHAAYEVIENLTFPLFDVIEKDNFSRDFKTRLQKYTQEVYKQKPVYRVTKESGPDHNKLFEVEILIAGEIKAQGKGNSKKQAEQDAAEKLLKEKAEIK